MLQTAISVTTQVSEKCIVIDSPDVMESGMEMAGGSPPAEVDINVGPDVLPTAVSVTTQVSEKWMVIDSPDAVQSGMEMAGGSPPAEVDISVGPDVLLTAISVTTVVPEKWMERFVIAWRPTMILPEKVRMSAVMFAWFRIRYRPRYPCGH